MILALKFHTPTAPEAYKLYNGSQSRTWSREQRLRIVRISPVCIHVQNHYTIGVCRTDLLEAPVH
jgi:hypothetical protein